MPRDDYHPKYIHPSVVVGDDDCCPTVVPRSNEWCGRGPEEDTRQRQKCHM